MTARTAPTAAVRPRRSSLHAANNPRTSRGTGKYTLVVRPWRPIATPDRYPSSRGDLRSRAEEAPRPLGDQSGAGLRPGQRVRHAQFGVGSVISIEEHNDDLKVTVRFNTVGVKKLLAKYARLQPA